MKDGYHFAWMNEDEFHFAWIKDGFPSTGLLIDLLRHHHLLG
jgi:hypothetical protein